MQQETNDILLELRNDIKMEAQDALGQGDRISAAALDRVVNALTRNIERRSARELADQE